MSKANERIGDQFGCDQQFQANCGHKSLYDSIESLCSQIFIFFFFLSTEWRNGVSESEPESESE